jgi:hypothetical protein
MVLISLNYIGFSAPSRLVSRPLQRQVNKTDVIPAHVPQTNFKIRQHLATQSSSECLRATLDLISLFKDLGQVEPQRILVICSPKAGPQKSVAR